MNSHKRLARPAAAAAVLVAVAACGASPRVQQTVAERRAAVTPLASAAPAPVGGPASAAPGATSAPVVGPSASTGPTTGPVSGGGISSGTTSGGTAIAGATTCGAAAPAGGNGGSTDTGVTSTSIKIGGTFFNGGYLDKYSQVSENAARAYFQYVNDQGGICGRKLEFVTCDTAGTADGTSGCLTKLADQQKVFMMGPSLDFNLDIVQKGLADRKLPWVGSSGLYEAEFNSPWMFPTQPPGDAVGALITKYAATKLGSKKIGVSLLNDSAGPPCTARAQKIAASNGAQVVATAGNDEVETSLDSQVSSLRNAKVDTVLFCNDPVNTIKFIQAAQRVGWKPIFVGGFVAADDVPEASGSNGKGMYGLTLYDFYGSQTAGVQQYRKITEYYYPQTFHHFYEQAAYVGAVAIVQALRQTGPKVTRQAFLTQLRSMRSFDSGLGLKIDFSNIKNQTPSGIMLRATDDLRWQLASPRFAAGS